MMIMLKLSNPLNYEKKRQLIDCTHFRTLGRDIIFFAGAAEIAKATLRYNEDITAVVHNLETTLFANGRAELECQKIN